MLRIELQADRVCCAVAGRQHLGVLRLPAGGRAVLVEAAGHGLALDLLPALQRSHAAAVFNRLLFSRQLLGALHPAARALAKRLADVILAGIQIHQRLTGFFIRQYAGAGRCIATRNVFDLCIAGQNRRVGLTHAQGCGHIAVQRGQLVEPAWRGAAFVFLRGFHLVLRIKMRTVGCAKPGGRHKAQHTLLPQRHQRGQCRVHGKRGVQLQGSGRCAVGRGDGDVGPHGVVIGVCIRHKGRQTVVSAAQKDHYQPALAQCGTGRRSVRPDLV